MTTCPKCGYTRQQIDITPDYECPRCKIIYSKFDPVAERQKIERAEAQKLERERKIQEKAEAKRLEEQRQKAEEERQATVAAAIEARRLEKEQEAAEAARRLNDAYIGRRVVQKHIEQAMKEFLAPHEILLGAFHGLAMSDGGYGLTARYKGGLSIHDYMLVTDCRVILWARGLVSGSTDGLRYEDISSVEEARGLLLGEIVLNIRGAKERLCNMVKDDVPIAAKLIRNQISRAGEPRTVPLQSQESIPEQIRKLAELRNAGILTNEEFTAKKADLLTKM